MVSEFVLIDLDSQASAVARYVQGWIRAEFVDWLGRFGEVRRWERSPNAYFFHSRFGFRTGLLLPDEGELIFIYDHTTHLVAVNVFST